MCSDLKKQIEALIASRKPVLPTLERLGYEIVESPYFGLGVLSMEGGEERICYHPQLKTADP
jgi:hypothetical protein